MELAADIAASRVLLFGILLLLCQMLAYRLGHLLGVRRRVAKGDRDWKSVSLVVNSLLGLLGFTLVLMLFYGSARITEQREGVSVEAKAIGTAWQRAEALGDDQGRKIAGLLKEYGGLRLEFMSAPNLSPTTNDFVQRSLVLQSEIWTALSKIVRERSDPVAAALMISLNDVFDAGVAERFALETKIPSQLFWLLIGMALVSMAAFGFQLGMKEYKTHVSVLLLVVVWTVALVVILDLNAPRIGSLRTTDARHWALEGLPAPQPRVHPQ
jgi:hypothetical protein